MAACCHMSCASLLQERMPEDARGDSVSPRVRSNYGLRCQFAWISFQSPSSLRQPPVTR